MCIRDRYLTGYQRLSPVGKKVVSKVSSGERGQLVTIVCCASATGNYVPPAMVFARKRMKSELYNDAPAEALPLISDSGYMNTELFVDWLHHFAKYVNPSQDHLVLLILDNHSSQCSLDTVLFCREHFITLVSLPPHCSHMMQPLDKGFFGPLKLSLIHI